MKVELLKDAKVKHSAGEIVEVSPVEYNFMISVGIGKAVEEKPKKKRTTKKK